MTTKEFAKILQDKLTSEYGVELNVASQQQIPDGPQPQDEPVQSGPE